MKRFHRPRRFAVEHLETRQMMTADLTIDADDVADEEDPSALEWAVSGSQATDEEDPDNLEWAVNGSYGTDATDSEATDAVFASKAQGW